MTQLPNWILNEGKALVLAELDDVLAPIAKLAEEWLPVGRQLVELGKQGAALDDPVKLVDFVLANLDDASVTRILDEVDAGLAAKLAAAKGKFQDSQWRKLLRPVGELAETYAADDPDDGRFYNPGTDEGLIRIAIPELDGDAAPPVGKLDLTFGVAAASMLDIEAGSVWPFRSDEVEGGLLRIGAGADANGRAAGKLPVTAWATIGASAAASASGKIGFFYRPDAASTFAGAAIPALRGLANPFDLQSLANAMQLQGLEGFVFFVDGMAEGKASVSLGRDFAVKDVLEAKLGVSASVNFARRSSWVLSLRRNGMEYDVVLSRLRSSAKGWSVGASLVADVSGLARKIDKALTEALEKTGPLLTEIKPFLSPGTYVSEKLDGLVEDAVAELAGSGPLFAAIAKDIGLLTGDQPGDSLAVETWLWEKLTASIDDVAGGVTTAAPQFLTEVLDKLTEQLPGVVPSSLTEKARGKVETLVEKLLADFEAKKAELTANKVLTAKLAKELSAAGIKVRKAGSDAADKADKALEGVRALVAKYEEFTQKLHKVVQRATEEKIGVELAAAFAKEQSSTYEILGRFTDVSGADAQELWRQLMLGKMQAAQEIAADPDSVADWFALDPKSSIALTTASSKSFALTVDFLGLDLAFEQITSGEASITIEDGNVVLQASARAKKKNRVRESNFVSVYDFQRFKSGGENRSLSLTVDLTRRDENLKQGELREFLDSLVEGGLISQARMEQARALRDEASRQSTGAKLAGDIGFSTTLEPVQVKNLLALGALADDGTPVHRAMFEMVLQTLLATRLGSKRQILDAREAAAHLGKDDPVAFLYDNRNRLPRKGPRKRIGNRRFMIRDLQPVVDLASGLPEMFARMHMVYSALPQVAGDDGWDAQRYRREEQAIADAAKGWIKMRTTKLFSSRLNPAMIAFLQILAKLHHPLDLSTPAAAVDSVTALGGQSLTGDDGRISLWMRFEDGEKVPV